MSHKIHDVRLSHEDEVALKQFVTTGKRKVQEVTRARILLLANKDTSDSAITHTVGCSLSLVYQVRRRFTERGSWQAAITDAPRPGQPPKLDEHQKAFITAKACTDPPPGHAHWTIPELKRELQEAYKQIRGISDETVRKVILSAKLKPWREKNVVYSESQQ